MITCQLRDHVVSLGSSGGKVRPHGLRRLQHVSSVWYIPPGAWHSVKNTATSPLVMVYATVPNVENGLLSFFGTIATIPGQKPTVLSREELAPGAEHDFVLRAVTTNAEVSHQVRADFDHRLASSE